MYECVITGEAHEGAELPDFDDELTDMPLGWTKVTIQRRYVNPKWVMLQQLKNTYVEGMLQQMPEEIRGEQRGMISLQAEAQFFAFEQSLSTYLTETHEVYVSDDPDALEQLASILPILDIQLAGTSTETTGTESEETDLTKEDQ